MHRSVSMAAGRLDFGEMPAKRGLRLISFGQGMRGPDKYRILELRRRRAQIRARRALDVTT